MRQRILGGSKTRVYSSFGRIARPIGPRRRLQLETLEDRKLLSAAGLLYIDPLYGYHETENIQYGVGSTTSGPMSLLLDVYQPTNIGMGAVQANRPAVVIQDGGAWTSGDKDNGRVTEVAQYMVQRGYTVFIANYRQYNDHPSTADPGPWSNLSPTSHGSVLGFETSLYPGINGVRVAVEDFATAITYVRNNAATYGIDPNHIAGVGGSAGAIDLLDLQYNGNTTAASYRTQANISAVGSMMGDWDRVVAGGAPLFLWNNAQDPLILYNSDVEPNLHHQLQTSNIYYEQWMETPNATDHNVHYDQYPLYDTNDPNMAGVPNDQSELIEDRMRDFLAYHFTATGPITIFTNEPPTIDLGNHPNYAATWNFAPVSIEDPANATVTDPDGGTLASITVILNSPQAGDVLAATTTGSIVQSFVNNTLTLSGSDSVANYQTVLRSVTYSNTALGGPGVSVETANVVANDGTVDGNTAVATININNPPVVDLNGPGGGHGQLGHLDWRRPGEHRRFHRHRHRFGRREPDVNQDLAQHAARRRRAGRHHHRQHCPNLPQQYAHLERQRYAGQLPDRAAQRDVRQHLGKRSHGQRADGQRRGQRRHGRQQRGRGHDQHQQPARGRPERTPATARHNSARWSGTRWR